VGAKKFSESILAELIIVEDKIGEVFGSRIEALLFEGFETLFNLIIETLDGFKQILLH
jgi:hypothetical protein